MADNDNRNSLEYYTDLFNNDPSYSKPFPNLDEACRWSKIGEFLSQIPQFDAHSPKQNLRILDVGCGRGWLTSLANIYGQCDGIDPVPGSIILARKYFPNLNFYVGTVTELLQAPDFQPYDVVITSEVIEHIINKELFFTEVSKCLNPGGHLILTTPRGEKFQKYKRSDYNLQPIEAWISENDLCALIRNKGFTPIKHDRAYIDLPNMSLLYELAMNQRLFQFLEKLGIPWVKRALQYSTAIYQVWWCQKKYPN